MTRLGARRWARITLLVLIIGVAVVAISLRQELRQVWISVAYTDVKGWTKSAGTILTFSDPVHGRVSSTNEDFKLKAKRWSWITGENLILVPISIDKDESMLEETNRRAKGGQ